MTVDLSGLNPVQRRAVEHGKGPMLLLAGAGSGKTRVVTHRIARLLEAGEHPDSIVAMTFTNRAAKEMRTRVASLLGAKDVPGLVLSTFHSLGARFLRRHAKKLGRTQGFTVYDDKDQLAVIRAIVGDMDVADRAAVAKAARKAFDQAKNGGGDASDAEPLMNFPMLDIRAIGEAYDAALQSANAFDFGDLIVRPAQVLAGDDYLRNEYRRRWTWVLVDEFQDTNAAQYAWLHQLAPPGSNLFVVGDDDQSIYGWRGAEIDNILGFSDRYPTAEVIRLEQNYRSHAHILQAANSVIAQNENRLGKALWTDDEPGARLGYHEGRDARDEAAWVAGQISSLAREGGYAFGDVAILLRANHLSLDVEEMLARVGVPYVMIRGRAFYDRAEVRDAMAYIRLLVNPRDDVAFRRAVGVPTRGIGKGSIAKIAALGAPNGQSLWEAAPAALEAGGIRGKKGLGEFIDAIVHAAESDAAPSVAVQTLFERVGLMATISTTAGLDEDAAARDGNLRRLIDAIDQYTQDTPEGGLAGYLEQVKLVSDVDAAQFDGGAVSIMTIHAAKGLEFPVVFVMAMEEGVFPSGRGDEEEERRLCYVAITRAERRLYFTRARQRTMFGERRANPPSRFLAELPREVVEAEFVQPAKPRWQPPRRRPEPATTIDRIVSDDDLCRDIVYDEFGGNEAGWQPGMLIYHAQFGVGRIQSVSHGSRITLQIEFPDVGRRRIIADFVSPYEG